MINLNIVDSIKNNELIPFPNMTVHNHGENEVFKRNSLIGSWDFFGIDSYELYKKNLKKQPEDWYYRHNNVKYTLNSYGYRTREFENIDWQNSVVVFGCSHIFGTGNDDEHTIPYFLEQMLGVPVINLGVGGSSIQLCLHNSLMLYKKYGIPKTVVYCWTSLTRHFLYHKDFIQLHTGFDNSVSSKVVNHLIPFNMLNVELIKNIWQDKCPLYEFSTFPTTSEILRCELYIPIPNDYARDLSHFGRHSNKLFAEKICNNIIL